MKTLIIACIVFMFGLAWFGVSKAESINPVHTGDFEIAENMYYMATNSMIISYDNTNCIVDLSFWTRQYREIKIDDELRLERDYRFCCIETNWVTVSTTVPEPLKPDKYGFIPLVYQPTMSNQEGTIHSNIYLRVYWKDNEKVLKVEENIIKSGLKRSIDMFTHQMWETCYN